MHKCETYIIIKALTVKMCVKTVVLIILWLFQDDVVMATKLQNWT